MSDKLSVYSPTEELKQIGMYSGADEDNIYLGEWATETEVKIVPLNQSKVVAVSTHGLISGEVMDLSGPALVLTLPDKRTEAADGLLTASEMA